MVYWTPDLAVIFENMHGYDITKYTMLLAFNNGEGFITFYPEEFYLDKVALNQQIVDDYRSLLSYLLTTYYDHLTNWTNEYLGLKFSAQVGYNIPVDMVKSSKARLIH
jgi:hypothetical protein